ncbi:MAG: hypothetical protein WC945_09070, partial [Bacteroidales bacterium]
LDTSQLEDLIKNHCSINQLVAILPKGVSQILLSDKRGEKGQYVIKAYEFIANGGALVAVPYL